MENLSKEKQIEEMAKVLEDTCENKGCNDIRDCDKCRAEWLYELGYRKSTDVAEEIFAEIEKIRAKEIHRCETLRENEKDLSERKYWEGGEHSLRQLSYWIAELKKKYTEEGK